MSQNPIVEAVLFQLREEVPTEQFLEAAGEVQRWLEQQPGYLRRELAHSASGEWLDLVHWQSLDAAQQAAETIMAAAEGQRFVSLIEGESIRMMHLEQCRQFG